MSNKTRTPRNVRKSHIDDDTSSNASSLNREMSASVETLNDESLSEADAKLDKLPSIENLFTLIKKDTKDQNVGCFRCFKCSQNSEVLSLTLIPFNILI